MHGSDRRGVGLLLGCVLLVGAGGGCVRHRHQTLPAYPVHPNERQKVVLPEYVIEPPDLLQIDLVQAVPRPPYRIQPLDVVNVVATNTPVTDPIAGPFQVDADGTVAFGGRVGSVKVAGLSPAEARAAIEKHINTILRDVRVDLTVVQGRGVQLVRGQHLVRPDGTVDLGTYGSVRVSGLTVADAKRLIEDQLGKVLQSPEVLVSVVGYNSKVYYVIFDLGGAGQQLTRLPITGNETVLDALSAVNGLTAVSDPDRVWVARSAACGEPDAVLPVDWRNLTCRGRSETNYQLMPGDRVYVRAYPLAALDVKLARALAPIERLLGFTLLGSSTYQAVRIAGSGGGAGTGIISFGP